MSQPEPSLAQSGTGPHAPAEGMEGMPARFGKYTLIRKLAQGGMAEVFLAIQKSVAGFEKLLVIKRILPQMNQDQGFIDMLLHEARIAATLSHPNIVQIFDVGQIDGQFYIAMEHVHGEDLRSIVRMMKKKEVLEFPLEHALGIVLGMCAGLAYAHERHDLEGNSLRIVHRDISPQNVVVTFTGDVKIVDFGIAKSDTRIGEQTKSGKLKGKVAYMSPEQARGDSIDARTDIFATGIMLFELTTGKRLFKGSSEFETLKLICEREYPRPTEIVSDYPIFLEPIVMKALAKDPSQRYQSARDMQADIEAFVRNHQIAVSNIALNHFMQGLFEEKLAQQKEAILQGKQLADIIDMQTPMQPGVDSTREGMPAATSTSNIKIGTPLGTPAVGVPSVSGATQSMPPAARTLTDAGSLTARRRKAPMIAGVAAGLVAAAVAAGTVVYTSKKHAREQETALAAAAAASASAAAEAARLSRGALALESDPPGASIWVNGDLRPEVTPATIASLPANVPLDVKVTKDGFEQARQEVRVAGGTSTKVKLELHKGSVVADVNVTPAAAASKASFAIDGNAVSGAHIEGLTSGVSHRLTVSAPGYAEQTVTFTGGSLESKKIDVVLEKDPSGKKGGKTGTTGGGTVAAGTGRLNVGASGGWCNVTVDGAGRGATPIAGLELSAGSHRVQCTTPEGRTQTAVVTVPVDGTARYKFSL